MREFAGRRAAASSEKRPVQMFKCFNFGYLLSSKRGRGGGVEKRFPLATRLTQYVIIFKYALCTTKRREENRDDDADGTDE